MKTRTEIERRAICVCRFSRGRYYAKDGPEGRSLANRHHYIAVRFFRHSANRNEKKRDPIFQDYP